MRTFAPLSATILLTIGLAFAWNAVAADQTEAKPATPAVAPVYTVDAYDPRRNPEGDLKTTVQKAKAEGKRILIQAGGDWCGWCKLMNKYFHENQKVASALAKDYLIMKVNFSEENRNQEFLKKYPTAEGYPHLYVLDSDGKLLHSQGTAVLEDGKGYSEKAMLDFLARWAPKPTG